ncbi:hypothetical protein OH76DRAFT_623005 [Lentinus brumalis]|uniref:Uncharacterized protein n=1 Tax=Lentinus brumalis TaxID=2498619 RepID=A0A371D962_9APHY|nr:hypothetical protein OH76DRAFT_623005 [Polyporus brumalis]
MTLTPIETVGATTTTSFTTPLKPRHCCCLRSVTSISRHGDIFWLFLVDVIWGLARCIRGTTICRPRHSQRHYADRRCCSCGHKNTWKFSRDPSLQHTTVHSGSRKSAQSTRLRSGPGKLQRRFPAAEICACTQLLEYNGTVQTCRLAEELSTLIFDVWWTSLCWPLSDIGDSSTMITTREFSQTTVKEVRMGHSAYDMPPYT